VIAVPKDDVLDTIDRVTRDDLSDYYGDVRERLREAVEALEVVPELQVVPLAAGELYRLAQTIEQMPPPRGDQPREFGLTVRVPRLNAEVVLGDVIWNPSILEWTLRIAPPTLRNEEALDYPFRETQTPPEGTVQR
jgi:hypothetical protein